MRAALATWARAAVWRAVRLAHHADFAWLLPALARLPLPLAYGLSALRGRLNAATGRDWRSVALGLRHIRRQSLAAYALLPGPPAAIDTRRWTAQRFATEARDELEAQLVAANRLGELQCAVAAADLAMLAQPRGRGLVLLTPHFDSFYLGIAFLARATGGRFNSMASAVTRDPRVDPAVSRHFEHKYRGLERCINGGSVPDMEDGLRPFYRMLQAHETLVVLADAPVLPGGAAMEVDFLGRRRRLAGGALRLAQRSGSDLGAFVCRALAAGRYQIEMCRIGPASDPETLERAYRFLGDAILAQPGRWWAADLLPALTEAPGPGEAALDAHGKA